MYTLLYIYLYMYLCMYLCHMLIILLCPKSAHFKKLSITLKEYGFSPPICLQCINSKSMFIVEGGVGSLKSKQKMNRVRGRGKLICTFAL